MKDEKAPIMQLDKKDTESYNVLRNRLEQIMKEGQALSNRLKQVEEARLVQVGKIDYLSELIIDKYNLDKTKQYNIDPTGKITIV